MYYIGIDPSLNSSGIVVFNADTDCVHTFNIVHKEITKNKKKVEGKFVIIPEEMQGEPIKDTKNLFSYKPIEIKFEGKKPDNKKFPYKIYDKANEIFQIFAYSNAIEWLLEEIAERIIDGEDYVVGIEIPMGSSQGAGSWVERMFAISCVGIISRMSIQDKVSIIDAHKRLYTFRPHEIKKFITGKATSKKEVILKEVYKKYGYDTNVNDLADAFAIAKLLEHTYKLEMESI